MFARAAADGEGICEECAEEWAERLMPMAASCFSTLWIEWVEGEVSDCCDEFDDADRSESLLFERSCCTRIGWEGWARRGG